MVLANCGEKPCSGLAYLINLARLSAYSRRLGQIVKGKGHFAYCTLPMSGTDQKKEAEQQPDHQLKLSLNLQSSCSLSSSSLRMAAAFSSSSRLVWFFFSRTSLDFLCTSANFPVGSGFGFSFSMHSRMTQIPQLKNFNLGAASSMRNH